MTRPRSQLVSLAATPFYHCISRCVRRAYLCGEDRFTGRSFDHRKPWLVERLALLTSMFAIDIAAYAVMSNHFHLVVHIDRARALSWSDDEVLQRWTRLYKGPALVQRHLAGETLLTAEENVLAVQVRDIREKLCNLSKFMAALNEYIARKANLEDGCTGRFWEGRFKSQALLDETALLSCMTYVDLNPVRAGIAKGLEDSDFTSVQDRVAQLKQHKVAKVSTEFVHKPRLLGFREHQKENNDVPAIPFSLKSYLDLADWTGRNVRKDKTGSIPASIPGILESLDISGAQWHVLALEIQKQSILMLNGLDTLARIEKKAAETKVA